MIPREIQALVFVDDVQIAAYSHHDLNKVQRVLQQSVNSIANWAMMNGFSFSASKTVVMQFYKVRAPILQPKIYLHNNLIPEVISVKFMGLVWDPKLTWVPHVAPLKNRCMKAMNLLRSIMAFSWGADTEIGR